MKVIASFVLTFLLLGILYSWLGPGELESARGNSIITADRTDTLDVGTVIDQTLSDAPQTIQPANAVAQSTSTQIEITPSSPKLDLGTYARSPSIDLRTYYVFMGIGGFPDAVGLKQQYNLNDQEVSQLIDYANYALKSDRANQSRLQAYVCASRTTYKTLDAFGIALNEFNSKAEKHQESLGRDAQPRLGPVLYEKVKSVVGAQRPSEQVAADFTKLLVQQNRDLQTEIERFCNLKIDT